MCAGGLAVVAACTSASKGYGVFAARPLRPGEALGTYVGEALSLGQLLLRYGDAGGDEGSPGAWEAANQQAEWVRERQSRGVGVSGTYVFNAGACPLTGRAVLLDAEDPSLANFTRFLNHSVTRANLCVERSVEVDVAGDAGGSGGGGDSKRSSRPVVRFVVSRPVEAAEELLFDYGEGVELDVLGFEE